jgi:hypothetical protein
MSELVSTLYRDPHQVASLDLPGWDRVIRQAERADLLANLALRLEDHGLLPRVPVAARNHLESARMIANRHALAVRWEIKQIQHALAETRVPIILLKGAAYLMAGLPAARGRLFHDVDILVPKAALETVEQHLHWHGWVSTHLDAYDQHYYRTWMHELPPLRHVKRQTVLDVHHTILPPTARLHPDPGKLLTAARPIEGYEALHILAPVDMVLHSATHLFHEGEFTHGLRDLVDLDSLLRHFGVDDSFWSRLTQRVTELDLMRPLYYALRHTSRLLATPIPTHVMQAVQQWGTPPLPLARLMDALLQRALPPDHPSCNDWASGLVRWLLYVRSHYLRMPLHLLIPHLLHKGIRPRLDRSR